MRGKERGGGGWYGNIGFISFIVFFQGFIALFKIWIGFICSIGFYYFLWLRQLSTHDVRGDFSNMQSGKICPEVGAVSPNTFG